ncbi:MAG: endonuclease [Prolixibacteraceae bacterium]|nr:endonuclease [Prolixibacteraceae bacterium]
MKQISVTGILAFLLLAALDGKSQNNSLRNEYTFMFYNVENFFDCEDDSLTDDNEFTPEGERRWNRNRLYDKADRLSKVVLAAGKWNPPIFVGLCEVENLSVLELLTRQTSLKNYSYKIVHKDSPDERGIDVAFIYRSDLFRPFDYQAINLTDPADKTFKTRDMLRVSGVLKDCDTLHLFINHWPSRYGGIMETMKYRRMAAETLKKEIKELLAKYPGAKVICTGDFNDTPKDESLYGVLGAKKTDNPAESGELINLSYNWMSEEIQTLKNQYSWQVFDQWIVSDYFVTGSNGVQFLGAEIFKAAFLLEPDSKFRGVKPKRTYNGFKHQEGFSDHLPILLRVNM